VKLEGLVIFKLNNYFSRGNKYPLGMSSHKILVTGGAGFIGSHLVDALLKHDHHVTVLDNLDPQVHKKIGKVPPYLAKNIRFIHGDIRNPDVLAEILPEIEVVYHLAASVGIAQSMYMPHKFYDNNVTGTANLLDSIINSENSVSKFVLASSMSIYGEGSYNCPEHAVVEPLLRQKAPVDNTQWELKCPVCQSTLIPIPTSESKTPHCSTIYSLTKKDQEDMVMMLGKTYGINTTALRFFGTYGPRQALSNPYTGVCAIFSTSLLSGNSPLIYEDGHQSRDLIYVSDIVQALLLSMGHPSAKGEIFNVGTGKPVSILEVANILGKKINPNLKTNITNEFRAGDVRHIIADVTKIKAKLGFLPKYTFETGSDKLLEWVIEQNKNNQIEDNSKMAKNLLQKKGLI
jgi:dTDP-L-rhamnose 4-epimerase